MRDVAFEQFGGLNLVQDPQEAGANQAISCLNVFLDRNGRVRSRDGLTTLYDSGVAASFTNMIPVSTDVILAALSSNAVHAIDLGSGTSLANASLAASTSSFAAAGTSGGIYFTDTTTTQVRRYQGGAFSSPAGLAGYEGNFLAVQPIDDRLVIADANSTSKLWFSDVALPETINASNFVQLTPGDGESIQGMAVFANELYVFKETKFFVFYGNSVTASGNVVFNYRMVDTGIGATPASFSLNIVATHETGVYFISSDGVYRTAGGPPEKISGIIDPVFAGNNLPIPDSFTSVTSNPFYDWYNIAIARDQLFASASNGDGNFQFMLELDSGVWTVQRWPSGICILDGSLLEDSANFRGSLLIGGFGSDIQGHIFKSNKSITTDDGTAISWHHQSGIYDLGSQKSKRIRDVELWGSGTPTVSILTDHATSDSEAGSVTLGASPVIARGWHSKSYSGVLISHRLSGTSAAAINRIILNVADERVVS